MLKFIKFERGYKNTSNRPMPFMHSYTEENKKKIGGKGG